MFEESVFHILSSTQYFRGVDTAYIKRSIFGGLILLVLSNTQYFLGFDSKGYWCIPNKKH